MGKNTHGRAVLLNKQAKSVKANTRKTKAYIEKFVKTNDPIRFITPPTQFEKALIVQEPSHVRLKSPKKILLPELIYATPFKTLAPKAKKTATKKTATKTTTATGRKTKK